MTLWKIEIFDNANDIEPARTGLVNADSEEEAMDIAKTAMGDAIRADMQSIRVRNLAELPKGEVLWFG